MAGLYNKLEKTTEPEQLFSGQRIVVLGSNLAGLTAAYELQRKGAEVTLIEKAKTVGKSCSTVEIDNRLIDVGEHIFPTFSQKAIDFWRSIIGDDFRPLYYRHGNLTDIGLLPHVDTVEEFRIILSSKDFDKFYRNEKNTVIWKKMPN